jgi:hypothetical protein
MRRIEIPFMVVLAAALPLGCGTEGDADPETTSSAAGELARIDFEDGNSVRFETLDEGVLVSEVGLQGNARHLVVRDGMSALDAFHGLAPGREVPRLLMQAHQRMYPPGANTAAAAAAPAATPDATHDPDLHHNGQFEQALPFQGFEQQMCDFPSGIPNFKHHRLFAHTHTVTDVNTAYVAVGSDRGIFTAKACANGKCNTPYVLQAGAQASVFYDSGTSCSSRTCPGPIGLLLGQSCIQICGPRKVKFELITNAISSDISVNDCGRFTR